MQPVGLAVQLIIAAGAKQVITLLTITVEVGAVVLLKTLWLALAVQPLPGLVTVRV